MARRSPLAVCKPAGPAVGHLEVRELRVAGLAVVAVLALCGCGQPAPEHISMCPDLALSPDGQWLFVGTPPCLLDLVKGEATPIHYAGQRHLPSSTVRWSPDSSALIFATPNREELKLDFVLCSAPAWGCQRLDVGQFPGGGPLAACYVGNSRLMTSVVHGDDRAYLTVADIRGAALVPSGKRMVLGDSAGGAAPLYLYQGLEAGHVVAVTPGQRPAVTYGVDVEAMRAVPLLYAERVRDLTGITGEPLSVLDHLGDVFPGVGGRWLYAALHPHGVPIVFARADMGTGEAEKLAVVPDALPPISPSPDGDGIAFARFTQSGQDRAEAGEKGPCLRVCVSDPWLRDVKELTSGRFDDRSPIWNQPLGEIVFIRDRREVWAVPIEGGEARRIWGLE